MIQATSNLIKVCDAGGQTWLAARESGIGASEAAAACGISRWDTPLDLWSRKTKRVPPKKQTDLMLLGNLMEPAIRQFFCHKTGLQSVEPSPGLFRHPEVPCVLASPDDFLSDGTIGEYKRTGSHVYSSQELGESGTDEVPIEWFMQAMQLMAVTGKPAVRFGVLLDARELRTFVIERNSKIIDKLIERDVAFWEHVQTQTPPEVNWEHKHAADAVRAAFMEIKSPGEFITLDDEAGEAWSRYRSACDQEKEAKKVKESAQAELYSKIQDAAGGILPSGDLLKKIVVQGGDVSYYRDTYSYLRATKGPKQ